MEIENLCTDEQNTIHALPFYVVILIASADGHIDESEIKKSLSIINTLTKKETHAGLTQYYSSLLDDFEDKLKIIIANTPHNNTERTVYLSKKIIEANIVLHKLEKSFVTSLHNSLRDLARQIAKASGGILGYGSIGIEESSLVNLDFLALSK